MGNYLVLENLRGKKEITMAIMDPISDMFTRIRNAIIAKHEKTSIPHSSMKVAIAKILKSEGFIIDYRVIEESSFKKSLEISVKYTPAGDSVITVLKKLSKPSKRIFVAKKEVPKPLNGFGISIVSTSKGVLSGREARLNNVGGELIGIVY
jgi:small subunit ribosomal protein S8